MASAFFTSVMCYFASKTVSWNIDTSYHLRRTKLVPIQDSTLNTKHKRVKKINKKCGVAITWPYAASLISSLPVCAIGHHGAT